MGTVNLIKVFHHTMEMVDTDPELKQSTEELCRNTVLYEEGFHSTKAQKRDQPCPVLVVENTTFRCAHSFAGKGRIAVLNFANPFEPGGNVKGGCLAQEESLCRCSNLYSSLVVPEMMEKYYQCHLNQRKNYLFSDRIIYSPSVTVLKADEDFSLLPDPFQVDVLTCAAPYNVFGKDPDLLKRTYCSRLTNIFEAAADNGVDFLVLGAFGCGEFHNPPDMMATAFKELIDEKYSWYFEQICFAIKASKYNKNFAIFSEILGSSGNT